MKKTTKRNCPSEQRPNADFADPTATEIYRAAKSYVASGLSLIPIRADGSKMPAFELLPSEWSEEAGRRTRPWKPYKESRPTLEEIRGWFRDSGICCGMAIIGGKVSGGLEIIDCDNWDVAVRWSELVEKQAPGLLDRLVRVRSPRPGLHAYYRCAECGGNQKLARVPDPEKDNQKPKTIIEVKAEAGYCLAPPSPAACHKSGRFYTFMGGKDLTMVPTITPQEREILLGCARKLNCWSDPQRAAYTPRRKRDKDGRLHRPGDDFNVRGDWNDILQPHGWKWLQRVGDDCDHWRRPGKGDGVSASTNFGGSDLLYVFSSNAHPFEEMTAYTKFHAFTLLNHDGDHSAAARALLKMGYGGAPHSRARESRDPFERYATYASRSLRTRG